MREIKFRFWDANTKVMDYDRRYIPWADEEISVDAFFDTSEEPPESTWLQWAGPKDKNDVEIYEADIVEDDDARYIVEYEEETAQFILVWCDNDDRFEPFPRNTKGLKVIGNIYEHPELLNQ